MFELNYDNQQFVVHQLRVLKRSVELDVTV